MGQKVYRFDNRLFPLVSHSHVNTVWQESRSDGYPRPSMNTADIQSHLFANPASSQIVYRIIFSANEIPRTDIVLQPTKQRCRSRGPRSRRPTQRARLRDLPQQEHGPDPTPRFRNTRQGRRGHNITSRTPSGI